MNWKKWTVLAMVGVLCSLPVAGQGNPTGRVTGTVTDEGGAAVPGVLVTATSPNLQGERTAVTAGNGAYLFGALPAGVYTLSYELEGFDAVTKELRVASAQTHELNVNMSLSTVSEEIVVTGETGTISEGSSGSTTYQQEMIEDLPIARNIANAVALAPGTSATGPGGNVVIAGAQSWENLYLLNGVPINENLRGQDSNIFIEDSIQETTTSVSGVSAEYGRFSGGVVNTLTKSGGNQFSFSLRDNFTNQDWQSQTPFGEALNDEVNEVYEATFGGYVLKDRLWFFTAARDFDTSTAKSTNKFNVPYSEDRTETRLEGKITLKLHPSHSVLVSVNDVDDTLANDDQGGVQDTRALSKNSGFPEEAFAVNYTGLFTDNFFVEAQYSERSLEFVGIGGTDPNPVTGTPILPFDAAAPRDSVIFNPVFSANSTTTRQSDHTILKGSYFLATESAGYHDMVFGVDTFNDEIIGDNTQSSTDFDNWASTTAVAPSGEIVPIFRTFDSIVIYRPVLESSLGSNLQSDSAYFNDRWQLNDKWSVNLGVRYDKNSGEDSAHNPVSDDSKVSPRLGVSWDPKGDGNWIFSLTGGTYVSRIAQGNVGDRGSAAGTPAFFAWLYTGPNINEDLSLTAAEANGAFFDWFESIGGVNSQPNFGQNIPGATTIIDGHLKSPEVREFSLSLTKRLGNRGILRAEYINRDYKDMFATKRDLTTGQGVDPNGAPFDQGFVVNEDDQLTRRYDGLLTQFTYRVTDRLDLGGNWTWSDARGNLNGEGRATGPITSSILEYPEFKAFPEHNPERKLAVDQEHKVRAWGIYRILDTAHHGLSASLLQNFFSGQKYSLVGAVDTTGLPQFADLNYIGDNLSNVNYYFIVDGFKTDDVTRTDLALNYSFRWNAFGRRMEVAIQPEVLNVFNEQAIVSVNANDVEDATVGGTCSRAGDDGGPGPCQTFDPFTETPVQGIHFDPGPNFGQIEDEQGYQIPRTYRFSVLFRF